MCDMRLISQDGKIDIPYENNVIYIQAIYGCNKEKKCHDVTGYKIITPLGDDTWNLGEYSNEVKALITSFSLLSCVIIIR